MLYTIVDYNLFLQQMQSADESRFVPLQAGVAEIEPQSHRIKRIVSTDLADYLNAAYTPGSIFPQDIFPRER
jgi:hypothetical protein